MKKIFLMFVVVVLGVSFSYSAVASDNAKKTSEVIDAGKITEAVVAATEDMKEDTGADVVAFDGLCPVCVFNGKLMKGIEQFKTVYEGKTYYFVGQEQLDMFLSDPVKFLKDMESKVLELKEMHKNMMGKGSGFMEAEMKGSDHGSHGSDHEEK